MHPLLLLIFLVFLSACNSQDEAQFNSRVNNETDQLTPTNAGDDLDQSDNSHVLNRTPPEIKQLQSSGLESEKLVIRWPRLQPPNPFSSDSIHYEIWHNDIHIDTVTTNSYLLTVNGEKTMGDTATDYGCIRLRAVKRDQKSELSEPTCYAVAN